jgi:hypothetical protein
MRRAVLGCGLICLLLASARVPARAETSDGYGKGALLKLTDDGESYLRFLSWAQIWARYIEYNPGSTVNGAAQERGVDVGLRRVRMLLLGQITPRIQIVTHFGINNQTFNNARKPQLFLHDAWVQYRVHENHLSLGGGLHYWNGLSRLTNASTLTMLAIDAPILNWPTIDKSDQFARQLGVWAKGQLGGFDYRIAVNHPFQAGPAQPTAAADYNPSSFAAAAAGYFQWQFLDRESNLLPFTNGSYLGALRVFNLGAGFYWHPHAMWSQQGDTIAAHDMVLAAADAFLDLPLGPGALTAYGAYYYYDMGPNNLRSIGIMNYAEGGSTLNGAGNAYPLIGTGSHIYAQAGYLVGALKIQPYATLQYSLFDALDDPAVVFDVGLNWFQLGHHAKLTLNYRNRPIFEQVGARAATTARRGEVILQGMVFL